MNSLSQKKKNCLSLEVLLKLFPIGIFPLEIFSIEDAPTGIFIVWLPPTRTPVMVFRMKKTGCPWGGAFGVMKVVSVFFLFKPTKILLTFNVCISAKYSSILAKKFYLKLFFEKLKIFVFQKNFKVKIFRQKWMNIWPG